jgi:hypothetical protein
MEISRKSSLTVLQFGLKKLLITVVAHGAHYLLLGKFLLPLKENFLHCKAWHHDLICAVAYWLCCHL